MFKQYVNNNEKIITYNVDLNNKPIEKVNCISYKSNYKNYSLLRNLKLEQYDTFIFLRNKKGFNTFLFSQKWDIFIANKDGKIIHTFINVSPGFTSDYYNESTYIYFSTVGTIKYYGIQKENIIKLRKKWS